VIALVGESGNAHGSHLHFEIRQDGQPVNPLPLLGANRITSPVAGVGKPKRSVARRAS
jgi:murein DD-endopeptidase MepM/ murein hydrolase activator NlpD